MSADLNTILEVLAAGPGQGTGAMTRQALLAQMAEDNPTVGLLAKYFTQRQEQSNEREGSSADGENSELSECSTELERAQTRTIETTEAVHELREKIERLYAELETLRERNDSMAVAVGACPLCWGEDVQCPVCRGAGQPGFTMPNRELFVSLIAPAASKFLKRRSTQPLFSRSTDRHSHQVFESPKGE